MIGAGIFSFTQSQANVFDFTAFVYIYFAFTSLVIVVELCTLLRYEEIVLKYNTLGKELQSLFKFCPPFCLSELKVGAVNLIVENCSPCLVLNIFYRIDSGRETMYKDTCMTAWSK